MKSMKLLGHVLKTDKCLTFLLCSTIEKDTHGKNWTLNSFEQYWNTFLLKIKCNY